MQQTSDYDFDLPPDRIAQHPRRQRSDSALLVLDRAGDRLEHRTFRELPQILRSGDLLVINDAAVVPARLLGRRTTGGKVSLLVLRSLPGGRAEILLRSGRKPDPGQTLLLEGGAGEPLPVRLEKSLGQGRWVLDLTGCGDLETILAERGRAPLPPYIHRPAEPEAVDPEHTNDLDRYQTVYARSPGAIAAPTAGLHFTAELLEQLNERGVEIVRVTLWVGEGTFRPVSVDRIEDHTVAWEEYEISPPATRAVDRARAEQRRVIAVGTTACRTLESAASETGLVAGRARTDLFIHPPFEFQVIDALLTNFHLPRSSLLMLVSALAGRERTLSAYLEAIDRGYRFYSYGDAMLIV